MLALFVLTAVLAGGLIFVKFQLEHVRRMVQGEVERTLGTRFDVGEVSIDGLRGLRIADFHAVFDADDGPMVDVRLPSVHLELDLLDLLYRRLTIDRVHIESGTLVVRRDTGANWLGGYLDGYLKEAGLSDRTAFRVTGAGCTVRFENVVGDSAVSLEDVRFDGNRLPDSEDISARIRGRMAGHTGKTFDFRLRYTDADDFDLRMSHDLIAAEDVNRFLPAPQQFVTQGTVSAHVRVAAYPGPRYIIGLDTTFDHLRFRDQPPVLTPESGTVSALAAYHPESHYLELTAAELVAPELAGTIAGGIDFSGDVPGFDLRFSTRNLSARDLLTQYLDATETALSGLTVDLEDDYMLEASLTGTTAAPVVRVGGRFSRGAVEYRPALRTLPRVTLQTGMTQFAWDSETGTPSGTMNITGGTIAHPAMGLTAEHVTGVLHLDGDGVTLEPIAAMITGNPVTGSLRYAPERNTATFQAAGTVAGLENLSFVKDLENVLLEGSVTLRCSGTISPSRYQLDVQVDATQANFGYEWWLQKPMGTGATLSGVHIDVTPGESAQVMGNFLLDATPGSAALDFDAGPDGYRLSTARARSETVAIGSLNKVLAVDYMGLSGGVRNATLEWRRTGEAIDEHILDIRGVSEQAEILPGGGEAPLRLRDTEFRLVIDNTDESEKKGHIELAAGQAVMPPFGAVWFVPLMPDDPEVAALYPPTPRAWTIELSSGELDIQPWAGTDFTALVHIAGDVVTIDRFSAQVGEGSLRGSYSLEQVENLMTLNASWQDVPAHFVLRHLNFPELLSGTMGGAISYTIDLDDPNTLEGSGTFDIRDGLFSADFLFAMVEERIQGNLLNLPPSLRFTRLRSDILLNGDRVTTNGLLLESEGLTLSGNGNFIVDGDLDYHLDLSINPTTAERIPALRDNLNIEGYRISQNNIQLGFHVTGPLFAPTGAVTGFPSMGVTLVSGAFELTSDAIKMIDIPRQILIDLFKIGGGIVGATK